MQYKSSRIFIFAAVLAGAIYFIPQKHGANTYSAIADDSRIDHSIQKTYTSQRLGISFVYLDKQDAYGGNEPSVREMGDRIYVYIGKFDPNQSQYIEIAAHAAQFHPFGLPILADNNMQTPWQDTVNFLK
jgi:hypothetical protein